MKRKWLMATLLCAPFYANASIISGYGVYTSASTASNCTSYCVSGGGVGDIQIASDGGELDSSATASENSYAHAQALAELTGTTYLPVLKVDSSAGVGQGGFARAFGVQGFSYSGDAGTLTLDVNLHGSVGSSTSVSNYLRADIAVISGNSLEWYPDFSTLVYEIATGDVEAMERLSIYRNGLDVNTAGALSFDVVPGLDFYVVASLYGSAIGGFADGWNTLTMSFDDDTGLRAASASQVSAVPVPGALWLFATGLLGVMGAKQRKRMQ